MTVAATAAAASSLPPSFLAMLYYLRANRRRRGRRHGSKHARPPSSLPSLAHFPQRSGERRLLVLSLPFLPRSTSFVPPPSGEFKHGAVCTLRVTKRVPRQLTKEAACSCPSWTDTIAVSPLICSVTERIAWQRRETLISLSCNMLVHVAIIS